jgi:hypothetical protein
LLVSIGDKGVAVFDETISLDTRFAGVFVGGGMYVNQSKWDAVWNCSGGASEIASNWS